MAKFKTEKFFNAPKIIVWEKLSDIGGVDIFHPMVEKSVLTKDKNKGVGTERLCTFYGSKGSVLEEVIGWDEGNSFKILMKEGSMPVKWAVMSFKIEDAGTGTRVAINGDFRMKGGIIGNLAGSLMMKSMMKKIMNDVLDGLERHIQTGDAIGYKGNIIPAAGTTLEV